MTWELVGRASEVERGLDALAGSRLLALTGAPGVGKSRLLAEVSSQFEASSRPVYRALATEATRTVPLSPFVALLPASPPPDPSLLLAAVVEAIDLAGGEHGFVLAVDDAHHLDDASLALLAIVMATSTARIALTTSDDHEPPPGLASLLRDDRATTLRIEPLGGEAVEALVEGVLGPADRHLHDELWRLSQGNPLVLREVLAGAGDRLTCNERGVWSATDSLVSTQLVDLARQRISALDDDVADALCLVAVGSPLPYDVLYDAVAPDVLDRLVAGTVVEVGGAAGPDGAVVVRPAHPLYGEVLLASLGSQALRGAYRQLTVAAKGGETDPLRVAIWQQRSDLEPDPAIAVDGARAALARHDGSMAATFLGSVEHLLDPATRSLLLGAALAQQGQPAEADATFARGVEALGQQPAGPMGHPLAVELASARAFNLAFGLRLPAEADAVLEAASEVVGDDVSRSRLDAERGVIAGIGGDFSTALAVSRRTVENPAAAGPALASAYVSLTLAETMLAQLADLEEHARVGAEVAAACADALPVAREQIRVVQADAAVISGDVRAAAAIVDAELANGRRLTQGLWLVTRAYVLCHSGQLPEAAEAASMALDHPELRGQFDLAGVAFGARAMAEAQMGRADRLEEIEEQRALHPEPRNAVWLDRGRAWTLSALGDHEAAWAQAVAAARHALQRDHIGWGVLAFHDAVRMGQVDEVSTVADEIADVVAATEGAQLLEAIAAHAQALAAEDRDSLLVAATAFASAGAPLLAADAAAHAASVAQRTGDGVACARATALSMAWHATCPQAVSPSVDARPKTSLTGRALEIALDAAAGATSAEIAAARYLSVRTVDNHLGAAYRALDVSGRTELAEVLAPARPVG